MLRSPVIGCEARTMANQHSSTVTEHESNAGIVPWRTLEHRTASAVTIGGVSLIGPDGIPTGNWVSGIDRVGSAVLAVTAGQAGRSERVTAREPTLLTALVLGAVVAGGGAVVLLAMGGVAPVGIGVALPVPRAAVSLQAGLDFTIPEWLFGSSLAVVAAGTLAVGHVRDDPSTGMVAVDA
jgi:hypothetical protein